MLFLRWTVFVQYFDGNGCWGDDCCVGVVVLLVVVIVVVVMLMVVVWFSCWWWLLWWWLLLCNVHLEETSGSRLRLSLSFSLVLVLWKAAPTFSFSPSDIWGADLHFLCTVYHCMWYLTKLYVGSALVSAMLWARFISSLHLCTFVWYSSNWIATYQCHLPSVIDRAILMVYLLFVKSK